MPLFTGLAKNMAASYFSGFPAEVRCMYVPTLCIYFSNIDLTLSINNWPTLNAGSR